MLTATRADIEAEVRYSVRHEYAQTAVDFLARRSRLAFLNAQAALDALPRVVDIMAGELGWGRARKIAELYRAVAFLESMGLAPGIELAPRTWREWATSSLFGLTGSAALRPDGRTHSRAQFEAGEVDALREAFAARASGLAGQGETGGVQRLGRQELNAVLHEVPGYEKTREKEFDYVLDEAGFIQQLDFDFDEFVEVWDHVFHYV